MLISHQFDEGANTKLITERLKNSTILSLPLNDELELLHQLSEFELGRFLLSHRGLNGYWTAYIILHAKLKKDLHPLEDWLVHCAPGILATQERFGVFQEKLHEYLKENSSIASIPCGLMDDLLQLNTTNLSNVAMFGIDLDTESLELARKSSLTRLTDATFFQRDAWDLGEEGRFDLITSNGLNIYEPDSQRVIALYQEFFKALKPGGILITSFLTPSPAADNESTWRHYNPEDILKQSAIFKDILQVNWQATRTEKETRAQLTKAGFRVCEVIYDSQGMFPAIVVQKPL